MREIGMKTIRNKLSLIVTRAMLSILCVTSVVILFSEPVHAQVKKIDDLINAREKSKTEAVEGKGSVSVIDFGAVPNDGADDTQAFAKAINAADNYLAGGCVNVPAGVYNINPKQGILIDGRTNLEINMDKDAHINVSATDASNYDVIEVRLSKKIYIHGGVIDGERARHIGNGGEHGMGVSIVSSKDVTLSNMTIQGNWGDGVYLGLTDENGEYEGSNGVRIANCTIKNNRRSNVSIVCCDNLTIDNCYIANANGTAPQCGINIEPNSNSNAQVPYDYVCGNIKILNTTIDTMGMGDYYGQYFCFMNHYNPNLTSRHTSDNIEIRNCHFNGDCGNYSGTNVVFYDSTIKGTFYDIQNTKFINSSYGSFWSDYAGNDSGNATKKPLGKTGVFMEDGQNVLYKDGCTQYDYEGIYNDDQGKYWIVENGIASEIAKPQNEGLVKDFTARLYTVALGRAYEETGLTYWSSKLISGKMTGAEVAQGFFFSEEFTNKNLSDSDYIETLYKTMFNRGADESGKAYWMNALSKGMSREFVYRGFAEGEEFKNLCESFGIKQGTVALTQNRDKNQQLTAFVARNYTKALGRIAEEAGLNDWTGRILEGKASPADVTAGFIFSEEFTNKNLSNEDFVKVLYQTYFDREADNDGFNDWVSKLNAGEVDRKYVVKTGFSCSAEFENLVKSFGL